jgi:phage baseplate assembly protein W
MSSNSLFPLPQPIQGKYIKILYVDVNTQFGLDNQQLLLENISAVNNEIINLILTAIGERHFEPEVGSELGDLIFDQPGEFTSWIMENKLFSAMARWMPNVWIDFGQSVIEPLDNEIGYYFKLVYSVAGLTGVSTVDFQFSV